MGATYEVIVKPAAEKSLRKLDRPVQRRIIGALERLAGEPRPASARKLTGVEDMYRIRVGDYRVVYQIQERELLVMIVRVGHRRDVYQKL